MQELAAEELINQVRYCVEVLSFYPPLYFRFSLMKVFQGNIEKVYLDHDEIYVSVHEYDAVHKTHGELRDVIISKLKLIAIRERMLGRINDIKSIIACYKTQVAEMNRKMYK